MGQHTTDTSLTLFDFLIGLGMILRYHSDSEYPMSENSFGSQAIDIAWFNKQGDRFPLFIFEIESTSNNSIANNPTKIFGKESKVFEKPLFFFHIIIDGAENSEKYNDLLGLFGKYNYDLFRVNNGQTENLILKIISQHRRIHNHIDLPYLIRHINNFENIKTEIVFDRFLTEIEQLIHENESYRTGQAYADIGSRDISFIEQYVKFIHRSYLNKSLPYLSYESYYASICSEFINLGILHCNFKDTLRDTDFKNLLIEAQKTETFDKIEYLPGLNYDYDIFIQDFVPFYLALTFFLFDGNISAQRYVLEVALGIIRKLQISNDFTFEHHVSWFLLMAASNKEFYKDFEEVKNSMNSNSGILNTILYCPIFMNDHNNLPDSEMILIPDRNTYVEIFKREFSHLSNDKDINQIAIMSLSEDWKDVQDRHFNLGVDLSNLVSESLS